MSPKAPARPAEPVSHPELARQPNEGVARDEQSPAEHKKVSEKAQAQQRPEKPAR